MRRHRMNTILPSPLSNGRGARPRDMQAAGFDEMVGIIARRLRAPVAVLVLTDLVRAGQLSISTAGLPNPELSQDSVAFATQLHSLIHRHQRPIILSDLRMQSDLGALPLVQASSCLAFLAVPVLSNQSRMIGALCVAHHRPHPWADEDVEALKDMATLVAREMSQRMQVAEQANEMASLRHRLERERLHNFQREAIFQAMATPSLAPAQRFRSVLNAGCAALKVDYGVLTQIVGGRARIIAASKDAPCNQHGPETDIDERYTAEILSGDRQIWLPDTSFGNEPLRRDLFGRPPLAFFGAPIVINGLRFGTLEFSAVTPGRKPAGSAQNSMLSMMTIAINGYLCARTDPRQSDVFPAVPLTLTKERHSA
ncbi:MAG: hypothetical protein CML66_22750 [Rhodobacteraceae bacterium]|nr:hypothetical protein [Paracoccaceae bacterium]